MKRSDYYFGAGALGLTMLVAYAWAAEQARGGAFSHTTVAAAPTATPGPALAKVPVRRLPVELFAATPR